jgi:hypothetical protein
MHVLGGSLQAADSVAQRADNWPGLRRGEQLIERDSQGRRTGTIERRSNDLIYRDQYGRRLNPPARQQ